MRGLGPSLAIFGVQVCSGGKINRRIKIVKSLASPGIGLVYKTGFV